MLCGVACPRCGAPRSPLVDNPALSCGEAVAPAYGGHRQKAASPALGGEEVKRAGGVRARALQQGFEMAYPTCDRCGAEFSRLFALGESTAPFPVEQLSQTDGLSGATQGTVGSPLACLGSTSEETWSQGSISLSLSGSSSIFEFAQEDVGAEANEKKCEEEEWDLEIPDTPPTQRLPPDFGDRARPRSVDNPPTENRVGACETSSIFSEDFSLHQPRETRSSSWLSSDLTLFRKADARAEAEAAAAAQEAGRKTLDYIGTISQESTDSYHVSQVGLPSRVDSIYCIQRRRSSSVGLRFSLASRSHCSTFASCSMSQSPPAGRLPKDASPSIFLGAVRKSQDPDQQHQQPHRQASNMLFNNILEVPDCAGASSSTATTSVSAQLTHPQHAQHTGTTELQGSGSRERWARKEPLNGESSDTNDVCAPAYNLSRSASKYIENAAGKAEQNILEGAADFPSKLHPVAQGIRSSHPRVKRIDLQSQTQESPALCATAASESRPGEVVLLDRGRGLSRLAGDEEVPSAALGNTGTSASPVGSSSVATLAATTSAEAHSDVTCPHRLLPRDTEHNRDSSFPRSPLSSVRVENMSDKKSAFLTSKIPESAARSVQTRHSHYTEALCPGSYFQNESRRSPNGAWSHSATIHAGQSRRLDGTASGTVVCPAAAVDASTRTNRACEPSLAVDTAAVRFARLAESTHQPAEDSVRRGEYTLRTGEAVDDFPSADAPHEETNIISLPHRSYLLPLSRDPKRI